jgi:protease-4
LWDKALSGTIQMPADAVNAKLIDGLAYQDQQTYKENNKKGKIAFNDEKLYSFATYAKDVDPYAYSENKIAVIYAVGEIVPGKQDPFSGIGSESFIASLKKARKDKSIKAIVIRVNSPGGSALASDEIAREIELCKKEKPLIASYGDVSASGGYYLSCVADSIVALPNTITGSIGVFALLTNVSDLFSNKLGLSYETVDLGTMSAGFRPDRPLNAMESAFMQRTIDSIYDDFLSIVSRGRKLNRTAVENLAQGHVYTAEDAKELGLVDILGGLDRAILSAARKAKLTEYRVVELPKKEDAISKLLNANKSSDEQAEKIAAKLGISTRQFKDFQNLIKLTGPQAYFPLSVEFR